MANMSATEAAPTSKPSPSGRLLVLVRQLIDYGKRVADALRQCGPEPLSRGSAWTFGCADVALILARITRGLLLAEALEARIIGTAARLDAEPAPSRPAAQRKPQSARVASERSARPAMPDLPGLPTAEQIAAEVRRRPIGAVIADICRDLCIMPSDPLWPELRDLIIHYDGSLARLVKDIFDRTLGPLPSARDFRALAAPAPPSPEPSGTGPP